MEILYKTLAAGAPSGTPHGAPKLDARNTCAHIVYGYRMVDSMD